MRISRAQIKLLQLVRDGTLPAVEALQEFCTTVADLDRLLAVVIAQKLIIAGPTGWLLTGDGRAILEFADELGGKAVG